MPSFQKSVIAADSCWTLRFPPGFLWFCPQSESEKQLLEFCSSWFRARTQMFELRHVSPLGVSPSVISFLLIHQYPDFHLGLVCGAAPGSINSAACLTGLICRLPRLLITTAWWTLSLLSLKHPGLSLTPLFLPLRFALYLSASQFFCSLFWATTRRKSICPAGGDIPVDGVAVSRQSDSEGTLTGVTD